MNEEGAIEFINTFHSLQSIVFNNSNDRGIGFDKGNYWFKKIQLLVTSFGLPNTKIDFPNGANTTIEIKYKGEVLQYSVTCFYFLPEHLPDVTLAQKMYQGFLSIEKL